MATKYTAGDLRKKLRTRYSGEAYAVLEEVANKTGGSRSYRWIDAVVIGLWPSKSLLREAFEVKVSRSDFLSELRNPKKSDWIKECCHTFWFVAPTDVIKEEELPVGVGWMRPHGDTLAIVRNAVINEEAQLNDAFVAALARSMVKAQSLAVADFERTFKKGNKDYLWLEACYEAVAAYLKERGFSWYRGSSIEEVPTKLLGLLSKASADRKIELERQQILKRLSLFQRELISMFKFFSITAFVGLTECDDLGRFIAQPYYYGDTACPHTIAMMRMLEKKAKDQEDLVKTFEKLKQYVIDIVVQEESVSSKKS